MAAHLAPCAVAGGAKGPVLAFWSAGQDVRGGSHRATDKDRLSGGAKSFGNRWMVRAKSACRAFSMDEDLLTVPIHLMLFDFACVVGNIVENREFRAGNNFGKGSANQGSDDLAIRQGAVS